MVKSKEFMRVESYLLKRYEELTRELRGDITQSEYDTLFHMRMEISKALLQCGILDGNELTAYRDGINAKISLEMQGH